MKKKLRIPLVLTTFLMSLSVYASPTIPGKTVLNGHISGDIKLQKSLIVNAEMDRIRINKRCYLQLKEKVSFIRKITPRKLEVNFISSVNRWNYHPVEYKIELDDESIDSIYCFKKYKFERHPDAVQRASYRRLKRFGGNSLKINLQLN